MQIRMYYLINVIINWIDGKKVLILTVEHMRNM